MGLDEEDLKRLLMVLVRPPTVRERRPRKCRRVQGVDTILAKFPPPKPVNLLSLRYNANVGDAGMAHLLFVPDFVFCLYFGGCGLAGL